MAMGVLAWRGNPLTLPLAVGFPALWSFASSRMVAALVSAGYFLAASRGLPQGVANFYGAHGALGFALWIAASLAFTGIQTALWTKGRGWRKPVLYGVAAIAMSIPPFGIVGWANPITAAGVLFPSWGWFGLAATAVLMLATATRLWPLAAIVVCGAWGLAVVNWTPALPPPGWAGIETLFRGSNGQYAGYEQQRETIELVLSAAAHGAKMIVLPESAAGVWTPTVERLWTDALRGKDVVVNAGAAVVGRAGYDNVMMEITAQGAHVLYHERMPVPLSMWQPWLDWIGQDGGARANFFANPIVESGGRRVAPVICYEQLLVWPILQSMLHAPDIIVASGNDWWTQGTDIVAIQRASTEAWARLFGIPLVVAFNT